MYQLYSISDVTFILQCVTFYSPPVSCFLPPDDGRVIKAINKNLESKIETVIIEDVRVFEDKAPISNLRVFRNLAVGEETLVLVASESVKSIPLHRCHLHTTCRYVTMVTQCDITISEVLSG